MDPLNSNELKLISDMGLAEATKWLPYRVRLFVLLSAIAGLVVIVACSTWDVVKRGMGWPEFSKTLGFALVVLGLFVTRWSSQRRERELRTVAIKLYRATHCAGCGRLLEVAECQSCQLGGAKTERR